MNRRFTYLLAMATLLIAASILFTWYARVANESTAVDLSHLVTVKRNPIDFDIQKAIRETESTGRISIDAFLALVSREAEIIDQAIQLIDDHWQPGAPIMMLESLLFAERSETSNRVYDLLRRKTDQTFSDEKAEWLPWIWNCEYQPHPQYAQFKSRLYMTVDSRFPEYFANSDTAKIRLDEIVWGSVLRDSIPPLKNPQMVTAEQATFLNDDNVVFGVSINGDHRCYPKRILAWHEMFKHPIGGQSICGAY